jgi:thiopeptide-type bacteriocin biosynthesis protein
MNELVIPFKTVPAAAVQPFARPLVQSLPAATTGRLPRRLPPGSEWLYAKLYTGSATVDVVLRELIAPVVTAARQTGAADSWFFIRYGDPEWHVRVRFHGAPARLRNEVLPALETHAAAGVEAGQIWRVQLDTYEREIERYGGDEGMLASEQLFCADSDAVLRIVGQLSGDDGKEAAWRLTLRGMDQLLDDVGLSLEDKHALLRSCRQQYAHEFHAERGLARQIGDKFRQQRIALEALLDRGRDAESELAPALRAFDDRSRRVRAISATLRQEQLPDLAASWLHMHANRMLAGPARAQELVLYDFLERLYEGRLARLGKRRA